MRPPRTYANPSDGQYLQIRHALHHQWRVATRAMMVLLSANGFAPAEIADLLGYDPVTIRRWVTRYATEGLPGLDDRPRSGRPRHGSADLGARITGLLARPRAWTTASVWRGLGRPVISLRTCYRRLREHARWARPRLAAKGDSDHDRICAGIRDQVTALPPGSVVLAEDETHLDLLARVRATWMPHRIRHRIPTPGSNRRRSLLGALNLATGAWHYQVKDKAVSATFCAFLTHLLALYPAAAVVMVICDNDTTHTSGITQRWLDAHPRLRLVTGARYSPQDNPVERIWAVLKRAIANTAPATIADRVRQAHAFFRHRTPAQLLATAAPWTSPWLPEDYRQDFWQAAKLPGAQRELLFVDLGAARNLVPVIDQGDTEDAWVIVMPQAEKSLRDLLEEAGDGGIGTGPVVRVLTDIAQALGDLSGRVVHRDLKPENVLVLDGRWCLADFGISRFADATTASDDPGGLERPANGDHLRRRVVGRVSQR